nr:reverse transcriptase domain-containing protein [Tanacetum cinerariifolium]
MQQPMQNPEDISDPTTTIDMTLVLMAKAFTLNNTIPTNNNQRSSSNPSNMQIAQSGMNMDQDRQMLLVENNVGNQFRSNAVQNIRNQIAQEEETGIQSTQEEFEFMAALDAYKETERVKASTSGTQSDKAPVYDSDGSAEYTELLEPIPEQHQVPHNDSNVISEVSSVEQGGGTEKLIMRKLKGKWIMKKEIRMISKDGKISELPEYTSSKEEDDEEEEEEEENKENGNGGNNRCSYKALLAFNPRDYDGKGGAVALTRWIEKMESVIENSGSAENQKVKYVARSFKNKALTWWNTQVQARGRKAAIVMSWIDFKALLMEEFCLRNKIEKLESEF